MLCKSDDDSDTSDSDDEPTTLGYPTNTPYQPAPAMTAGGYQHPAYQHPAAAAHQQYQYEYAQPTGYRSPTVAPGQPAMEHNRYMNNGYGAAAPWGEQPKQQQFGQ